VKLIWIFASVFAALLQDNFAVIHQEDFTRWSRVTGLQPAEIRQMWRSTSHYADENDDDSSIELVDVTSLASRNQILLIASAGIPKCLNVAVFSSGRGHLKLWQEAQGPDGFGFCDNLGIPAEINVSKSGEVEITAAVYRYSDKPTEAIIREYIYRWNKTSYVWKASYDSSRPIPRRLTSFSR